MRGCMSDTVVDLPVDGRVNRRYLMGRRVRSEKESKGYFDSIIIGGRQSTCTRQITNSCLPPSTQLLLGSSSTSTSVRNADP